MTKKHILIGTTAINRSILHKDVIPEWYNYINVIDKSKYDVKWFINIDYIEKLDENVIDTKNNFENIIKDIDKIFINSEKNVKGNFLKACKNISLKIENYVEKNKLNKKDVIIIWLEDDWKLNNQNIPLQQIIENYLSNLSYINLSYIRCNYIHALAPCIVNYELWSRIHLMAWKLQKDNIDPEHCVGLYFLKHFGKYENILNVTIINKYKKIDNKFFNQNYLKSNQSYYTFDEENKNNIINNKYINKTDVKKLIKDKITFIRITCSSASDYGRDFLKKYNLKTTKNN